MQFCVPFAVGRSWAHPRVLQVPQGGGDAVAPVGGEAVPDAAGRELQPGHAGGLGRLAAEPVCGKLEGRSTPALPPTVLF